MIIIALKKSFIKATTYVNKSGKTIHRKAYTDSRKAKTHIASNRARAIWKKEETHSQALKRYTDKHQNLIDDAKETLEHHEALETAKKAKKSHSEHGINVEQHHHVIKHLHNLNQKLEDSSQRIMLHKNRTSLMSDRKVVKKTATKKLTPKKVIKTEADKEKLRLEIKKEKVSIKERESSIKILKTKNEEEEKKVYKKNYQKIEFGRDDFDDPLSSTIGALNEKRRAKRIRENKSSIADHKEQIGFSKETIAQIENNLRLFGPTKEELEDTADDDDLFGFKKSDAEKKEIRSRSMKGNKNAWRGGPKVEPKTIKKSETQNSIKNKYGYKKISVDEKPTEKAWSPKFKDDEGNPLHGIYIKEYARKEDKIIINNGHKMMSYKYPKIKSLFSSPMVNDENLHLVGGWSFEGKSSDKVLLDRVTNNKKPAGFIVNKDINKIKEIQKKAEKSGLETKINEEKRNGQIYYELGFSQKGTFGDHFDIDKLLKDYDSYWKSNLGYAAAPLKDWIDIPKVKDLKNKKISDFLSFDYANVDKDSFGHIVTGLILGYPPETTFAIGGISAGKSEEPIEKTDFEKFKSRSDAMKGENKKLLLSKKEPETSLRLESSGKNKYDFYYPHDAGERVLKDRSIKEINDFIERTGIDKKVPDYKQILSKEKDKFKPDKPKSKKQPKIDDLGEIEFSTKNVKSGSSKQNDFAVDILNKATYTAQKVLEQIEKDLLFIRNKTYEDQTIAGNIITGKERKETKLKNKIKLKINWEDEINKLKNIYLGPKISSTSIIEAKTNNIGGTYVDLRSPVKLVFK